MAKRMLDDFQEGLRKRVLALDENVVQPTVQFFDRNTTVPATIRGMRQRSDRADAAGGTLRKVGAGARIAADALTLLPRAAGGLIGSGAGYAKSQMIDPIAEGFVDDEPALRKSVAPAPAPAPTAQVAAPAPQAPPTSQKPIQQAFNDIMADGLRRPDISVPAVSYGPGNKVSVNGKEAGTFTRAGGSATTAPISARTGRGLDVDALDRGAVRAGDPFSTTVREQGRANRKPGDQLGVRDIDGSFKTGAMSVVGSPYGDNATQGMRRLLEDADIRAGRQEPRKQSFDELQTELKKAGIAARSNERVARINAGGRIAAANAGQKGEGRKEFVQALDTRYPDLQGDDEGTNMNRQRKAEVLDYFDRSAQLGTPATLSEAEDSIDLQNTIQEVAARNKSVFGPVASHLVEFLTPDFAYRTNDDATAADPDVALKELDSFVKAMQDPKAKSYQFRGTDVPLDPGFFNSLFNEYPDAKAKQKAVSLLNKRRRALAAQIAASEDDDGDGE